MESKKPALNPSSTPERLASAGEGNLWSALGSRIGLATQAPIPRGAQGDEAPLSSAQQQLWVIHQTDPQSAAYNLAFAWHLDGPLQDHALEQSLNALVQRHESLRTVVREAGQEPVQKVVPLDAFKLRLVRMDALKERDREAQALQWMQQESRRPFVLAQAPLLRAVLLRLEPERHMLLLVLHHIICDAVSLGLLLRELELLYAGFVQGQAPVLPELPIRYADYALWEGQFRKSAAFQTQLDYWKKQLAGKLPVLELPADYPRPARFSSRGALWAFALPPELATALRTFRSQAEATSFQVLLAAFKVLLYRYTGQEDLIVGTPTAHRMRSEVRPLVGYFVNPRALRTQVHGELSFRELLRRVKQASLEAFAHPDVPFAELVEVLKPERDPSSTPVFQAMFSFQSLPRRPLALAGLQVQRIEIDTGSAKFDLTLDLNETAKGIAGFLEYRTDLFDGATIRRMSGHLQTLLASALANSDQPICSLPLMSQAERHEVLVEWNSHRAPYPKDLCLQELVEVQAVGRPDAIALVAGERRITYSELNGRANQLAHHLRKFRLGPDILVGVYLERSVDLVVALLGVLKAGGAYVPLDPAYPRDRIGYILQDAKAPLVLTQSRLKDELVSSLDRSGKTQPSVICLDTEWESIARESTSNLPRSAQPDHLAYVLYTSGSTGRPKGVAIEHRNAVAFAFWAKKVYGAENFQGVLFATSVCFDLSIFELFVTLSWGGKVILAENVLELPSLPAAREVTLVNTVPSAMAELVRSNGVPPSVRTVNLAGEPLAATLVDQIYQKPHVRCVYDLYGPTEDTTYSTFTLRKAGQPAIIGRPLVNKQVYILDAYKQPVPIGIPGELHIAGVGLARGYLNRPELTAERFIPNPFSSEPNGRMYRTGDLGRYRADGQIEYLGRLDFQVKIRGFRIELGEIEAVLRQHAKVRDVVVVANQAPSGEHRLVAYLVPKEQPVPEIGELRAFLKTKLPDYMVPAAFMFLEALPQTPNGKVDRKALPALEIAVDIKAFVAPQTTLEKQLASIWCETLGLQQVGIHDNFFELGGHSLKAVWLFQGIKKAFGKHLPMITLFQAPTIAQLAEVLAGEMAAPTWSSLVPIKATGSRPPFYCVHGVGGNILEFQDLVKYMDEDQPFYGVQAVGLDGKQPRLNSIHEMAAAYMAEIKSFQPQGPYYLGGSSFGGMVAYEIAQQLCAQGEKVGLLAFFDTWAPGYPKLLGVNSRFRRRLHYWEYRVQLHWSNLMLLPTAKERWGYLCTKLRKWKNGKRTQWTEFKQRWRRRWEEYFLPPEIRKTRQSGYHARHAYVPVPYPGKVTLFRATEQRKGIVLDPWRGWGELVLGGIEVYDIPGHHGAIMRDPRAKMLAAPFETCLRQAQQLPLSAQSEQTGEAPGR